MKNGLQAARRNSCVNRSRHFSHILQLLLISAARGASLQSGGNFEEGDAMCGIVGILGQGPVAPQIVGCAEAA